MPLGTLDRTPPPFFRQGPSALTKLVFFSALALFLMVADARLHVADPLRQALAIVLLPLQRALAVPVEMMEGGSDYLRGLNQAQQDERAARLKMAAVAERAARTEQLAQENARLRALLESDELLRSARQGTGEEARITKRRKQVTARARGGER